jgi:hypothetical protein
MLKLVKRFLKLPHYTFERLENLWREPNMRRFCFSVWSFALLATPLAAGQIYGTLREGGRGVAARIEIVPEGKSPIPVTTSANGAYSVSVPDPGRCWLRVYYTKPVAPVAIFSYAEPVKYDFDLIPAGNGYSLQRR